jgi:hypothetical protein
MVFMLVDVESVINGQKNAQDQPAAEEQGRVAGKEAEKDEAEDPDSPISNEKTVTSKNVTRSLGMLFVSSILLVIMNYAL